jgi:hypothetical protein
MEITIYVFQNLCLTKNKTNIVKYRDIFYARGFVQVGLIMKPITKSLPHKEIKSNILSQINTYIMGILLKWPIYC